MIAGSAADSRAVGGALLCPTATPETMVPAWSRRLGLLPLATLRAALSPNNNTANPRDADKGAIVVMMMVVMMMVRVRSIAMMMVVIIIRVIVGVVAIIGVIHLSHSHGCGLVLRPRGVVDPQLLDRVGDWRQ